MRLTLTAIIFLFLCPFAAKAQAKFTVNGKNATANMTVDVCITNSLFFENKNTTASAITWKFENGNPPSSTTFFSVNVLFTKAGIWEVLQIVTENGEKDTLAIKVRVNDDFPIPQFTFTPTTLECGSSDYTFTNTTTGGTWDFNDGGTSTAKNSFHQFNKALGNSGTETYHVKLTAINNSGCSASLTKDVTVKRIPDISLVSSDNAIQFGEFNGQPTFKKCNNIPTYLFPFVNQSTTTNSNYIIKWGDGSPDTSFANWPAATVISHTFKLGSSNMSITVSGSNGCTATKIYNVFLGSNPAAGFESPGNTEICAPDSLKFSITGFANNAPGTLYRVTVNDGTVPEVFNHAPPANVTHYFENSSCNVSSSNGSQTFFNSFRATLDAENPCGSTSVSVIPIYVSGKPNPAIGVYPSKNVCVNTNVTISKTGSYGGIINATGGGNSTCEDKGKQVWSISPSIGYSIVSGSLGNLNNAPTNGIFWTNGTPNLAVVFTTPGTYKIKQYLSNDRCGIDSTTETICVRNPPLATFTMDKNNACAPAVVNITNTTAIGTCGGERYDWTVTYADIENCGLSSGYSFTNNTSASSKDPQISFSTPGRYIVKLTVTTNALGCAPVTVEDTFYVKAKPVVNIPVIASVCAGNTVAPTATVRNCYSTQIPAYSWQFTNGVPANSTNAVPGNILFANQGNYAIKLDVTNECGTTTAGNSVNITSKPIANAGPNLSLCSGKTGQLGIAGGSFTYSWKPSIFLNSTSISNPMILPVYNGIATDTTLEYVLTVSAGANCVSADTVHVVVKKSPVVTISPLNTSICSGASALLTAAGADTYSWSPATNLSSTTQPAVTASPVNTMNYTITGSLANGCSATASATVSVVSFSVPNAGADKSYCSGQTVTIGTTNAGMNYSWSPSTGLVSANSAVPTVSYVYTGSNADTTLQYVLTASAGANCTGTDTVLVKVKSSPTVTVAPTSTDICPGGSVQLVADGAISYSWSPATNLSATNKDTVMANPSVTRQYIVTGSYTNGCSADAITTVNVKAKPTVNAGTDIATCKNFPAIQLNGTPSGGSWSGNAFISPSGVFNPVLADKGTFKAVYAFTANGCNNSDSLIITVSDPPVSNAGADVSYCSSANTVQLLGVPAGGTWSGNPVISASGLLKLNSPGIFDLVYTVGSGSCFGTDTVKVTVGDAVSNNVLTPVNPVCTGNHQPATIEGSVATAGIYSVSYQWQQSTDSIVWNDLPAITSKDYSPPVLIQTMYYRRLASSTLCSQGTPGNVVKVVVHPDAQAAFNPTQSNGCTPFVLTPAIVNLTAFPDRNSTYLWFVDNASIGAGEIFPGYTMTKSSDTITLKMVAVSRFGCTNDTISHQFITPPTPVPSFELSDTVGCGPLSITVNNITPDADKFSFVWDFGIGQISQATHPGVIIFPINPNYGDTVYTVSLKASTGCDTIAFTKKIRVRAKPKALFTPDIVEGCSPLKVTFTNTSRGTNASYEWDFGDGSPRQPALTPVMQHTFNTGVKDTFFVKLYASNDCGSDTQQYAIVVNPNRIRLDFAINGNQKNTCIPDTILFINNTTGANRFEWDFGDGSPKLTTLKGIDSVYHTYTQMGNFVVTLFGTNGCSDTTSTETILAQARPAVSFTALPKAVCFGDNISFTNTSDTGLAWKWDFGDGSTSNLRNTSKTYLQTGDYQVSLTGIKTYPQGFSCPATAVTTVSVNGPGGDFLYTGGYVCPPGRQHFEVVSNNTNLYTFYFGNGDSLVSNNPAVDYTYSKPGIYMPSVLLEKGGCSRMLTGIDTVRIEQLKAGFSYQTTFRCGSTSISFTDTSRSYFTAKSWEWNFGNGTASTQRNPVKLFTVSGTYNVQLRVTSSSGCISTITVPVNVEVRSIPVSQINNSQLTCTANAIVFSAITNSVDSIAANTWSFGNGSTAIGNPVSFTYANTGQYTVTLITRTAFGCADTVRKVLTIQQSPTVTAGADVRFCLGQSAQLSATGAQSYLWSPVQGLSCTNCTTPVAQPTMSTRYKVTGTNSIGCPATDSIEVDVIQPFQMTVTPNDTLCIGQTSQLFASGAATYRWNPSIGLTAANIPNPIAKPSTTTTYRVVGFDNYNCFTDTATIVVAVGQYPTVELGRGDTVVAGTAVPFKPLLTNGPFKTYNWSPATLLSCLDCSNPVATINNNITYQLTATNIYGCSGTDTISFQVVCSKSDQVYIPNAFSPDGDGINDVFMVHGKGIKVDYLRVFNRWGQLVFDGGSNYLPNLPQYGWDGKVNGKPATQDVYVYAVQVRCSAGGTFTYKGNVSLLLLR